ncbi:hypothetical protein E4631_05815 [Hymenobacter sp. UV11]|uniref:hypothetical protein n=1 Tax=Hymenobacter sp. UV11 TaxID=1849735 RepID=UPI00105E359F|nr:hypothetical protein [Hymenobacter sp. UV11]TDN39932.1 hypothetical protein A8B98_16285 [Hymenobacter sp. UV11]TFZ67497.1 hypothetical protein E4631_05815 [Hymenobacter sp. UV11]
MKVALEFPDEKAAFVMELLNSLPYMKARTISRKVPPQDATQHLESNPANKARVLAAIEQLENGQYEIHELLPHE